jgi:hypothetical protein
MLMREVGHLTEDDKPFVERWLKEVQESPRLNQSDEPEILIAKNAPGTRPTSPRDVVLLAWYEARGSETYHNYVNIVEKWNGLGREKWVAICPVATMKLNRQSAIKAIKAAINDRGDMPKKKAKQEKIVKP